MMTLSGHGSACVAIRSAGAEPRVGRCGRTGSGNTQQLTAWRGRVAHRSRTGARRTTPRHATVQLDWAGAELALLRKIKYVHPSLQPGRSVTGTYRKYPGCFTLTLTLSLSRQPCYHTVCACACEEAYGSHNVPTLPDFVRDPRVYELVWIRPSVNHVNFKEGCVVV